MKLTAYRRHLDECEHRPKGQSYTLCGCPVWVYGGDVRRSLKTNNWERALQRIQNLELGGELEDPAGIPLGAATRRFLADAKARELAESTIALYRILFAYLEDFCGESCALPTIDTNKLDLFRQSRCRPVKDGEPVPLQPSTQRKEIGFLRSFFRWCAERDLVPKNPATGVRMPEEDEESGTLPFETAEVHKLILACDQITSDDPGETPFIRHRARALVYALLYSGLRISDIAQLRRAALDPNTRYLAIRKIKKTKVWLKIRIHPDAVKALESLPAAHPDYFFWSGNGKLETLRKNLARTINRLGVIAGVKATPHRFRDTFAVELLTKGNDIRRVQQLLGHKSLHTTEKHYAHFVPAHQAHLDSATDTLDFSPEGKAGRPLLVKTRNNRRRNS